MCCNNIKQAFTSFPKVCAILQQGTVKLYIICKIVIRGIHEIVIFTLEKPFLKITQRFSELFVTIETP
jgi:hypothetical protein